MKIYQVIGYEVTVSHGPYAGQTYRYSAEQGKLASKRALKLDREYGPHCATFRPVTVSGRVAS